MRFRKASYAAWPLLFLLSWIIGASDQAEAATGRTAERMTVNAMASRLFPYLERRQTQFTVTFPSGDSSRLMAAFQAAIHRDDYLREDYHSMQVQASVSGQFVRATYQVQYLESAAQVAYVKRHLSKIVTHITRPGMDDVQKEEAIHNYIVLHTAYDTSLSHISPYDALTTGTTVCQGYAMMAYLMLRDAHIENFIVDGTADGQAHAWNLVKIDGNWYNLDVTWDDPVPNQPGKVYFDYFNLSSSELARDHSWTSRGLPKANTDFVDWLMKSSAAGKLRASINRKVLISTGLYLDSAKYTYNSVAALTEALNGFTGNTMVFRYPAGKLATDLSLVNILRPFNVSYVNDRRYPAYDIVTLTFTA